MSDDKTKPFTPAEIAELRRLEAAATPGEWESGDKVIRCNGDGCEHCWHTFDRQCEVYPPTGERGPVLITSEDGDLASNANFIAALRNAAPRLLAAAEREGRLRAAINLTRVQFLAAGGNLSDKEVLDAMNKRLDAALAETEVKP